MMHIYNLVLLTFGIPLQNVKINTEEQFQFKMLEQII